MWQEQWVVLIALPLLMITAGLVLLFLMRKKWDPLMLTSIAFICGGGLGNLIDRISLGYVVDLFDFRVFPVFNVADSSISVGVVILLLWYRNELSQLSVSRIFGRTEKDCDNTQSDDQR